MRIALVQMKPGADIAANRTRAEAEIRKAKRGGAQVIAFPELALTPFFPKCRGDASARSMAEPIPGPTTDLLCRLAGELEVVVIFNLYEKQDDFCYDSSPVIDANGALLGTTRMVHITDFPCFHEQDYYAPGNLGAPVYQTRFGRIGVAICYDRHYPEYMRALGVAGAELVVIPQAGVTGEWPEGLYEAEVRTAAFQNGYFAALCNRVGCEDGMEFAGESFIVDPEGTVAARAPSGMEDLMIGDVDLSRCPESTARRLFWRDRRPELYARWLRGA